MFRDNYCISHGPHVKKNSSGISKTYLAGDNESRQSTTCNVLKELSLFFYNFQPVDDRNHRIDGVYFGSVSVETYTR